MLINLKTQDREGFLKEDTKSTKHKRLINLTSLNLKAYFHQRTLKAKSMTGGPCMKCIKLTIDLQNSYTPTNQLRKNPVYLKNGQ